MLAKRAKAGICQLASAYHTYYSCVRAARALTPGRWRGRRSRRGVGRPRVPIVPTIDTLLSERLDLSQLFPLNFLSHTLLFCQWQGTTGTCPALLWASGALRAAELSFFPPPTHPTCGVDSFFFCWLALGLYAPPGRVDPYAPTEGTAGRPGFTCRGKPWATIPWLPPLAPSPGLWVFPWESGANPTVALGAVCIRSLRKAAPVHPPTVLPRKHPEV